MVKRRVPPAPKTDPLALKRLKEAIETGKTSKLAELLRKTIKR